MLKQGTDLIIDGEDETIKIKKRKKQWEVLMKGMEYIQ
jgi:hypothetical protein